MLYQAESHAIVSTITQICTLCTNFSFFRFGDGLYRQKAGLPMGSPLSGILACLFLEALETESFRHIIPEGTIYFRYVDDALIIYPRNTDLSHLVTQLNKVEPCIRLTFESEVDNYLPFLDIRLHNNTSGLLFSVYRKPTCKNDLIHFFSHHHNKIKSGVVIGSFLRALRICSPQFLADEFTFIEKTYSALHYPTHFIQHAKRKAHQIFSKNKNDDNNTPDTQAPTNRRFIILPTNPLSSALMANSSTNGLMIATTTSQTIGQILKSPLHKTPASEAGVYRIPCADKDCGKSYFGETSRSLKTRISEHMTDLRNNDLRNAMTQHRFKEGHNPNFSNAHIVKHIHETKPRQILESAAIATQKCIKQRPGNFHLATNLAHLIVLEHGIRINSTTPKENG